MERRVMIPALIVSGVLVLTASSAHADPGLRCRHVQARITVVQTTADCTSPLQFCTSGQIQGGGLLSQATTAFSLLSASARGPGEVSYTGGWVSVTARGGTLRTSDVGHGSFITGEFFDEHTITGGTGVFAGATGVVVAETSRSIKAGGEPVWTGTLTGDICVPK